MALGLARGEKGALITDASMSHYAHVYTRKWSVPLLMDSHAMESVKRCFSSSLTASAVLVFMLLLFVCSFDHAFWASARSAEMNRLCH